MELEGHLRATRHAGRGVISSLKGVGVGGHFLAVIRLWVGAAYLSCLLRLDAEPFYELIADHSDVARGIMEVLVQRLRRWSHKNNHEIGEKNETQT